METNQKKMSETRNSMLKLGEWLEKYLNPKILPSDFRELASSGIELLNIDYDINDDDLTFKLADLVYEADHAMENNKKHRCYYMGYPPGCYNGYDYYKAIMDMGATPQLVRPSIQFNRLYNLMMEMRIEKYSDPLMILNFLAESVDLNDVPKDQRQNRLENKIYPGIVKFCYETFYCITKIESVFWYIKSGNDMWSKMLIDNRLIYKRGEPIEYITHHINDLIEWYDKTSDTLKIVGHNFKTLKRFVSSGSIYGVLPSGSIRNPLIYKREKYGSVQIYPWYIVSSQIFFNFLMLGGEKRIIFCKHCGRFCVAERMTDGKPDKKFCSDKCRAANKRALTKKS